MSVRNNNRPRNQAERLDLKNTFRAIISMAIALAMCPLANAFQQLPPVLSFPLIPETIAPLPIERQETELQTDEPEKDIEGVSTMLRGPLHEAFAEQFSSNPIPGETIDKEPPPPINEVPPAFEPEGVDIEWIPGYWGWDVESQDFIWVTGIWRNVPPDQQWIPGYWNQTASGWQWISGFWMSSQSNAISYLPIPPESLDHGPSSPPPGDDYFWVSGSWKYNAGQYVWEAGQWAQGNDDWIWVPNRYVWTSNGCIYRSGYWDYVIEDRGTVFCPVVFSSGYVQPSFRPNYALSVGPLLLANLFVAPGFHHYYYGNYQSYRGRQPFYPWVNYYQQTRNVDPLYTYYAYQRRNSNFIQQIGRIEHQIATNPTYRSQSTVFAQINAMQNAPGQQAHLSLRAATLASIANRTNPNFDAFRFKPVEKQFSKQFHSVNNPARELASQRATFERDSFQAKKNVLNPLTASQLQSTIVDNSLQLKTRIEGGRNSTQIKTNPGATAGNGNPLNSLVDPNNSKPGKGLNSVDPIRGIGQLNGQGQANRLVPRVPKLPPDIQINLPSSQQNNGQANGIGKGREPGLGNVPNNNAPMKVAPGSNPLPESNNIITAAKPIAPATKPNSTPVGPVEVNALKGMLRPGIRQPSSIPNPSIGPNNPQTLNKGQPNQGQPNQGQPNQGQPNQSRPKLGQPNQGQPNQGQPNQGKPNQGKPNQGKPNQGKPNQGQPNLGQPNLGQPNQGQPIQGKPNQGKPNLGQPNLGKPNQQQPSQRQPIIQGQPIQGQPNRGKPNQGQPLQGQSVQGRSNQGQPNQGQPNQGQPPQGKPNQGLPIQGLPKQSPPNQLIPNPGQPNPAGAPGKNGKSEDRKGEGGKGGGRGSNPGPGRPGRADK